MFFVNYSWHSFYCPNVVVLPLLKVIQNIKTLGGFLCFNWKRFVVLTITKGSFLINFVKWVFTNSLISNSLLPKMLVLVQFRAYIFLDTATSWYSKLVSRCN